MSNIRKITGLEVSAFDSVTQEDLGRLYSVVDNQIQYVETRKVAIVESDHLDPLNPVEDTDMIGTMACWHDRYTLGHVQPKVDPEDYKIELIEEFESDFAERLEARAEKFQERHSGTDPFKVLQETAEFTQGIVDRKFDEYYLSLPLYLYDHSGITMSTGSFSCAWDSGQVGFVYLSKQSARTTWGWSKLTKARVQQAQQVLKAEVSEYDDFLRGDTWAFHVNKEAWDPISESWEVVESHVDSCGGFLGNHGDPVKTGILDHLGDDVSLIRNIVFDDTYEVADLRSPPVAA